MRDPSHDLPESVAEIAEVLGTEKALEFIGQLPSSGSRPWRVCVYIPKRLPLDHPLVDMLGWQDAARMSNAFAGMILQPANCGFIYKRHRRRRIFEMLEEGLDVVEIADAVELSVYRVREIIMLEATKEVAHG